MAMVTLQPATSREASAAAPETAKDPLAGMTLLTADGQQPRAKAAIEITKNALKRIRVAMAKEGVSPDQGGLRVGIQGGGCSGLSYNIRFDSRPRERDPEKREPLNRWRSHLRKLTRQINKPGRDHVSKQRVIPPRAAGISYIIAAQPACAKT